MSAKPVVQSSPQASTPARLVLALIRTYQLMFAWMYAGSCRFTPSCSHYAAESIRRFGAVRGTGFALRRLIRCRPFGAHGIDPVPDYAPSALRRGRPENGVSALRQGKPGHRHA